MKPLIVTQRQADVLDALCEFGQTDLAARRLGIGARTIEKHLQGIQATNKYPNRLTLVLAWDRQKRSAP